MANQIKGQLIICLNKNASAEVEASYLKLAKTRLSKEGLTEEQVNAIYSSAKVIRVAEMTEQVGDRSYPTSPFELVNEHDQKLSFSTKGDKPSLRFRINLTKLNGAPGYNGYDRVAYATSARIACFSIDTKGIARLNALDKVAQKLNDWKEYIREALAEVGLEPKHVAKYDLKSTLGDAFKGITPYCVTLPEVDSGIISFVVAVNGKNGTYFKQAFTYFYNVGLTHTGGTSNHNPDSDFSEEELMEFASGLPGHNSGEEQVDPDSSEFDLWDDNE